MNDRWREEQSMARIRWACWIGLCSLLAACASLGTENIPATLQHDLTAYGMQATEIRVTGQARATQAAATVVAAQTQVAYYSVYNQVLVATVRANETAVVPQMVVSGGEIEGSLGVAPPMEFLQVAMSDRINETDRCALNDMALFDVAQTPRVYLTAVVTNIVTDTELEVIWMLDEQQVHSTTWSAPQSSSNQCVAMELTPEQTAFVAGNWEATLLADGRVIQSVPFAMIQAAP
ncbi:hypothetical protein HC776_01580 [bacterium]|nr:hypothetical protein [bacterium]